jgi:hypothetical protein
METSDRYMLGYFSTATEPTVPLEYLAGWASAPSGQLGEGKNLMPLLVMKSFFSYPEV